MEETRIRIGMKLIEEHQIEANGTALLVGAVEEVWLPQDCIEEDGFLNIEEAETLAISGLDGYHKTDRLEKMEYMRVDNSLKWDDGR